MNIAIIVMTIIGLGLAVIDVQKQQMPYAVIFIYYTTLSNLFLFCGAIICFVFQLLVLLKRTKHIPKWSNIFKMCAITTTTITFLVVVFFLTPIMATSSDPEALGPAFLYTGSNCIFHVLNPIVGILVFLLFEQNDKKILLPQVCFGMIFTSIYGIFYSLDVVYKFVTLTDKHDWYNFLILIGGNIALMPLLILAFIGISFLITWLLWFGNKKINILNENKHTSR